MNTEREEQTSVLLGSFSGFSLKRMVKQRIILQQGHCCNRYLLVKPTQNLTKI